LFAFITLIVSVAIWASTRPRPPQNCLQVRLSDGEVLGTAVNFEHDGVPYHTVAFLGVPFAEDTGGANRFKKPRATQGWKGVFDATYKRLPCPQRNTAGPKGFFVDSSNATEDCLHLNVWVPADCVTGTERYPVVLWAYGGGFTTGGNSFEFYDGRFISGFGKLVVVVPNYRVGVLGFLNAGTPDVPGNMALHDMIAAHGWVTKHIDRFGGDKDNIILAGQSAGSIIFSLLMISPALPWSFYSKAYLMSGSAFTMMPDNSRNSAKYNFEIFAKVANCSVGDTDETLVCLRRKNATDILSAERKSGSLFTPSFYDGILPDKLPNLLNFKATTKTVLLSAARSDGSGFFELAFLEVVQQNISFTPELLFHTFPHVFDKIHSDAYESVVSSLQGPYNISQDNYMGWKEILGDILFRCPMHFLGEVLSENGATVYLQEVLPKPSFSVFSAEYTSHSEDMLMLFGYSFIYPSVATDEDRNTTLRMIKTLGDFAREG
ncbi:unnamed protein product, partial [Ixodes hexagonus]